MPRRWGIEPSAPPTDFEMNKGGDGGIVTNTHVDMDNAMLCTASLLLLLLFSLIGASLCWQLIAIDRTMMTVRRKREK